MENYPVSEWDVSEMKSMVDQHRKLLNALIDPDTDLVTRGKKSYKRKSYWRKLASVAGISIEKLEEHKETNGEGNITWYVTVRASLPNGQFMDGTGACTQDEPGGQGNIVLRTIHETRATAETRAKNRAISDLTAFGEVSAEEISDWEKYDSLPIEEESAPSEQPHIKLTAGMKERSYQAIRLFSTVLPGSAEKLIEEEIHEKKFPEEVESTIRRIIIHEMNEMHNQGLMRFERMKRLSEERFGIGSFEELELEQVVRLLLEIQSLTIDIQPNRTLDLQAQ